MRRQFMLVSILLCALALSGWEGVLAAAMCPHAESERMSADHACCHTKNVSAHDRHCSKQSHEAMRENERGPEKRVEPQALRLSTEPCSHCIARDSLPAMPAKAGSTPEKRPDGSSLAAQDARLVLASLVRFVSAIVPTQGAPPRLQSRRHLLLSIFLI